MPAAYRIRTPRLALRCWDPADAPLIVVAITESLEQLRPWMPWAALEPQSVVEKARTLQGFRRRFDAGKDWIYGIFDPEESQVWGSIGAHRRIGAGAWEIGYWIHSDHVRRGLATEASGALIRTGFETQNVQLIEIQCDPANVASAAVPRKLGMVNTVTIRRCVHKAWVSPRDNAIWSMPRGLYPGSPAARLPYTALDAVNGVIASSVEM